MGSTFEQINKEESISTSFRDATMAEASAAAKGDVRTNSMENKTMDNRAVFTNDNLRQALNMVINAGTQKANCSTEDYNAMIKSKMNEIYERAHGVEDKGFFRDMLAQRRLREGFEPDAGGQSEVTTKNIGPGAQNSSSDLAAKMLKATTIPQKSQAQSLASDDLKPRQPSKRFKMPVTSLQAACSICGRTSQSGAGGICKGCWGQFQQRGIRIGNIEQFRQFTETVKSEVSRIATTTDTKPGNRPAEPLIDSLLDLVPGVFSGSKKLPGDKSLKEDMTRRSLSVDYPTIDKDVISSDRGDSALGGEKKQQRLSIEGALSPEMKSFGREGKGEHSPQRQNASSKGAFEAEERSISKPKHGAMSRSKTFANTSSKSVTNASEQKKIVERGVKSEIKVQEPPKSNIQRAKTQLNLKPQSTRGLKTLFEESPGKKSTEKKDIDAVSIASDKSMASVLSDFPEEKKQDKKGGDVHPTLLKRDMSLLKDKKDRPYSRDKDGKEKYIPTTIKESTKLLLTKMKFENPQSKSATESMSTQKLNNRSKRPGNVFKRLSEVQKKPYQIRSSNTTRTPYDGLKLGTRGRGNALRTMAGMKKDSSDEDEDDEPKKREQMSENNTPNYKTLEEIIKVRQQNITASMKKKVDKDSKHSTREHSHYTSSSSAMGHYENQTKYGFSDNTFSDGKSYTDKKTNKKENDEAIYFQQKGLSNAITNFMSNSPNKSNIYEATESQAKKYEIEKANKIDKCFGHTEDKSEEPSIYHESTSEKSTSDYFGSDYATYKYGTGMTTFSASNACVTSGDYEPMPPKSSSFAFSKYVHQPLTEFAHKFSATYNSSSSGDGSDYHGAMFKSPNTFKSNTGGLAVPALMNTKSAMSKPDVDQCYTGELFTPVASEISLKSSYSEAISQPKQAIGALSYSNYASNGDNYSTGQTNYDTQYSQPPKSTPNAGSESFFSLPSNTGASESSYTGVSDSYSGPLKTNTSASYQLNKSLFHSKFIQPSTPQLESAGLVPSFTTEDGGPASRIDDKPIVNTPQTTTHPKIKDRMFRKKNPNMDEIIEKNLESAGEFVSKALVGFRSPFSNFNHNSNSLWYGEERNMIPAANNDVGDDMKFEGGREGYSNYIEWNPHIKPEYLKPQRGPVKKKIVMDFKKYDNMDDQEEEEVPEPDPTCYAGTEEGFFGPINTTWDGREWPNGPESLDHRVRRTQPSEPEEEGIIKNGYTDLKGCPRCPGLKIRDHYERTEDANNSSLGNVNNNCPDYDKYDKPQPILQRQPEVAQPLGDDNDYAPYIYSVPERYVYQSGPKKIAEVERSVSPPKQLSFMGKGKVSGSYNPPLSLASDSASYFFTPGGSGGGGDDEPEYAGYEKKKEVKVFKEPTPPPVPKVIKVGSILVRNNVENDFDYAENVNRDLGDDSFGAMGFGGMDHGMPFPQATAASLVEEPTQNLKQIMGVQQAIQRDWSAKAAPGMAGLGAFPYEQPQKPCPPPAAAPVESKYSQKVYDEEERDTSLSRRKPGSRATKPQRQLSAIPDGLHLNKKHEKRSDKDIKGNASGDKRDLKHDRHGNKHLDKHTDKHSDKRTDKHHDKVSEKRQQLQQEAEDPATLQSQSASSFHRRSQKKERSTRDRSFDYKRQYTPRQQGYNRHSKDKDQKQQGLLWRAITKPLKVCGIMKNKE